jgi:hypothetical protein
MKKLLLSLSLLLTAYTASSQLLESQDFSNYTVGNIGTDVTGATPGQDDWLTAGGANADYQIVNVAGTHGNVFQMTGSATATGNKFMWKDGFTETWDFRDPGNDILSIAYDLYTGPVTTSKNSHRVTVFNLDGTKILGGLLYTADTRVLSGLSYYNNAGTFGNYSFNPTAAAGGPVVLPANTWVRVGFSFNKTTGQVLCKTLGLATNLNMAITGAAAGVDPTEVDVIAAAGTANAVASVAQYDNYTVTASSTDVLLAVDQVTAADIAFAVYPNPATTVVNVSNKNNAAITSISITDLNGRVVKQTSFDNVATVQVNVSELSAGAYMMNISSNEGTTTKKIIKN